MNDLVARLRSGEVLVMDGAMGTELIRLSGSKSVRFNERFNLTNPNLVRSIHAGYVAAGADVLLTNTFQANLVALAQGGLDKQLHAIWEAAIRLAREATPRFVLADVGPISNCTTDIVDVVLAECVGVDGVLLETWTSFDALAWFAKRCKLPLLVSFTFRRLASQGFGVPHPWASLETFDGAAPEECAREAARLGITAIGATCGEAIGMNDMVEIAQRFRSACALPIFVKPNAGTPTDGRYPLTVQAMATGVSELLRAGVAMIGGCCGTTAEHVRAIRAAVEGFVTGQGGER
jgi:5-methyltetrahydrofolate--homocysteine methyltransferase